MKNKLNLQAGISFSVVLLFSALVFCFAAAICAKAINLNSSTLAYVVNNTMATTSATTTSAHANPYYVQIADTLLAFSIFWFVSMFAQVGVGFTSRATKALGITSKGLLIWNVTLALITIILAGIEVGYFHDTFFDLSKLKSVLEGSGISDKIFNTFNTDVVDCYNLSAAYVAFTLFALVLSPVGAFTPANKQENAEQVSVNA